VLPEVLRDRVEQIDAAVPAVAPLPAALEIGKSLPSTFLRAMNSLATSNSTSSSMSARSSWGRSPS
jgi:hypothetical protein